MPSRPAGPEGGQTPTPARPRLDGVLRAVFGDTAHRADEPLARRRRLAVGAVLAIALASMGLSTLNLLAAPPFTPPDETPHVGYALSLANGEELPRVTDVIDHTQIPHMKVGITQSAVTHPPLVYLVLAGPLLLGEAMGAPVTGLLLARGVIVASAGIGYVLLGWLALALLPRRMATALTATAIAALIPNHVHIAGQVYTDAPGFAAITGLLLAGVLTLTRGLSPGRLTALILLGAVAANFRVVGAVAAIGVAGAAGIGAWLHPEGRRGTARVLRGIGTAAAVAGSAAATSAWFYATNLARYGSATGADSLMELHQREELRGTVMDVLVGRTLWRSVHAQMWSRVETWALEGGYLPHEVLIVARPIVHVLLAVAVVVALHRLVVGGWRRPAGTVLAWAMLIVWLGVVAYGMADFVQGGGGMHARYLWPAIAIVVLWLAFGLAALPGARRGLPALAFVGLLLYAAGNNLVAFTFRRTVEGPPIGLRLLALERPGAAIAVLAGAGLVVALAVAWWAQAVVRLAPHDERPTDDVDALRLGVATVGSRPVDLVGAGLAWLVATAVGVVWHDVFLLTWPVTVVPALTALLVLGIAAVVARRSAPDADTSAGAATDTAEETVPA
jgi:hypothetical protein